MSFGQGDEQKREDIIIKSLLQQIPGMGRVSFDKLYRLARLAACALSGEQRGLGAATSIPAPLCERIADKFQEYRAEALGISQHDAQSGYRARLTAWWRTASPT
jgi:hypothetical protein